MLQKMLHLSKFGNIKIGGTENGLPQQYQSLRVTKCNKNGEENFETFDGFPEAGQDQLQIMLPFIEDLDSSFEVGLISFLTINEVIKYYAKEIEDNVYLIPLQPNMKNPLKGLPVIKLGLLSDWESKLDLKTRALLYAYLPIDNSFEFAGNGTGVFHFKTSSAHSIEEIKNTFALMKNLDKNVCRMTNLTLEVHTKLVKMGDIEEITYVRLLPPTPEKIKSAYYANNNFSYIADYLNGIEKTISESKKEAIANAITMEEAEKFFNSKIVMKLDNNSFELAPAVNNKVSQNVDSEEEANITAEAEKIAIEKTLPLPMVKTLISKKGLAETLVIIDKEKTVENIIKYIAGLGSN